MYDDNLVLKILCDFFNGEKTQLEVEKIDWKFLFDISKKHQITSIIFEQLKDIMPKKCFSVFESLNINLLYLYVYRDEIIKLIKEELEKNNIKYFFVKGVFICNFYPNPALRTMGDIDLIVDDRKKTNVILEKLGFENIFSPPDKEWIYKDKNIQIELHNGLYYDEFINKKEIDNYLSTCFDYVVNSELDENFHFIYHIVHFRKHLLNYGVGLRQFLDLAFWVKNGNLNYEYIKNKLIELNLYEFTKVCFCFLERWFNLKSPFEETQIDEDFYNYATNQIIKNGVFGFDNEENQVNNEVNYLSNKKHASKIRYFIRKLFPSYKTLCNSKKYMFIKGKCFLLPFVWVYRWIGNIISSLKHETEISSSLKNVSNEQKEKRQEYIKYWKLDN